MGRFTGRKSTVMKTIFKLLKWMLVLVLVLAVVGVLARNFIARKAVEVGMKQMTGFPLTIGAVDIGLVNGKLEVRDLKLMNPPEFQEKMFVDLPGLYVDYKLGSMIAGTPHVKELRINLNEVVVVKNEKGETNALKLKSVAASSGGSSGGEKAPPGPAPTEEKKATYKVDLLKVHVGTVRYLDYSKSKPTEKKMVLNLDATYKDIDENTNISRLVLVTALSQAGIPDLSGVTDSLKKGMGDVTDAAGKAVKGAADAVQKTGQGLLDVFKKK